MALLKSGIALLLLLSSGVGQFRHSNIIDLKPLNDSTAFRNGLDLVIESKYKLFLDRNMTVIANQGSKSIDNQQIFDVFQNDIPGRCQAFILVNESSTAVTEPDFIYANRDSNTSVKFITLNSNDYHLAEKMIANTELIVVDLPNSGLRESLAIGVLIEAMKFSAEHQIPLMILDRPNPLMAVETGGPVSGKSRFTSGLPLPARHALTLGELALMINEENWLKTERSAPLTIIRMANYYRDMGWEETGLKWYYPEESIMDMETAVLYAGLYFFQFTNVSLGVGTIQPYQFIGAPWISGQELTKVLAERKLAGIDIYPVTFTPQSDDAAKIQPIYAGVECSGISVRINDLRQFDSFEFSTVLLTLISKLYPQHFKWIYPEGADLYSGDADFRTWVDIGADLKPMLANWIAGITTFQKNRLRYSLYPLQKK